MKKLANSVNSCRNFSGTNHGTSEEERLQRLLEDNGEDTNSP